MLAQALVGIGVLGIASAAFTSMMSHQQRSARQLAESVARSNASMYLNSVFAKKELCSPAVQSNNVKSSKPIIISGNPTTDSPQVVNLEEIDRFTRDGAVDSSLTQSLKVSNSNDGLSLLVTSSPGPTGIARGQFRVRLQQQNLVMSLPDILVPVDLAVNSSNQVEECATSLTKDSKNFAHFSWDWYSGETIFTQSGISSIDYNSGRPIVTFSEPMPSSNYVVVCNGSAANPSGGQEMQLRAYNKTPNSFMMQGGHGGGFDPIRYLDCLIIHE